MPKLLSFSLLIFQFISTFSFSRQGEPQMPKTPIEVSEGKVVYVTDGDTFHMLIDNEKVKIRMADIDAPETTQPFGLESKEYLMSMIKNKEVQIKIRDTDKYGRQVAFVYINGQDINLKMVQTGMAWWYEKYGPDNIGYKEAQEKAKSEKVGLWSKGDTVAPWIWRRMQGASGVSGN